MAELPTKELRDVSNGIIQGVDNKLVPPNSVAFAMNMTFDSVIGRAVVRDGTALVGSQIQDGKTCLGLHFFIKSDGTTKLLSVFNDAGDANAVMRKLTTGTPDVWSDSGTLPNFAAGEKVRFLTYLDTVLALDEGNNQKTSADGNTWVTSSGNLDVGNMPAGKFAIEWRDKIFLAGVSATKDTVFISSIPTAGAISWTSGNDSITIEPFEGQGTITGLGKVPGYVLIFKERALKRWNGGNTFPDDLSILGTPSHESIVNTSKTAMFFSAGYKTSIGFYETNGVDVRKISRPIQTIIEAIPSANYANVAGFSDGETAMWSIGDITFEGISYTNIVVLFHIPTKTWTVLSFPSEYKVFSQYIDGTTLKFVAGDDDGQVLEIFTGTKDNITGKANLDIEWALQYHPLELGSRSRTKGITTLVPYTKDGKDAQIMARVDEKGDFAEIGSVEDDFNTEIILHDINDFHTLELRIAGVTGIGGEWIGLDILNPEIKEATKV